jgi:hypothetical protein
MSRVNPLDHFGPRIDHQIEQSLSRALKQSTNNQNAFNSGPIVVDVESAFRESILADIESTLASEAEMVLNHIDNTLTSELEMFHEDSALSQGMRDAISKKLDNLLRT